MNCLTSIPEGPAVKDIFRQIFPELVESRGITTLDRQDADGKLFSRWEEGNNEVTVELADKSDSSRPKRKRRRGGL